MARSFNGSSDQILTSNITSPAAATLFCWANPGSLSNAYNGVVMQAVSGGGFIQILLKSTGKVAWYIKASSTVFIDPGTGTPSGWTSLGISYDITNGLATYINGASDGTAASSGNTLTSMTQGIAMGYDNVTAGRQYPGSIAQVAYWSTNLTVAEHLALAKGALPYQIRPGNLIGYWPLDGLQSPEPDLSGAAHNGTLTGTALAAGPPVMMLTPRIPIIIPNTAVAGQTFKAAWAMRNRIIVEGIGI